MAYLCSMSQFDRFGVPSQFRIEPNLLRKRLEALNKQYHPDFYTAGDAAAQPEVPSQNGLPDETRNVAGTEEAENAEDRTIEHLLTRRGLLAEGERHLPESAFLQVVIDANEMLWEQLQAPDEEILAEWENKISELKKNNRHDMEGILDSYQEDIAAEEALLQVKAYYFRKKYLDRILDKIAALRNIAARL